MTIERVVRLVAGLFVLTAVLLGAPGSPVHVHEGFLWFAAFVGLNLAQSSLTGFCPLVSVLRRAGVAER